LSRGLRRFFVDQVFSKEDALLQLSPRETFHLHQVLRLKEGDRCQVFNRSGLGAEALIQAISKAGSARLKLTQVFPLKEGLIYLRMGQALPQKRKMDWIVEKAEELGVQELWALETERTMVRMRGEARARAKKRWERIVVAAAKQSGSPVLTTLEGPHRFEEVVKERLVPSGQSFLFHPDPRGLSFSKMMEEITPPLTPIGAGLKPAPTVFLFFGPEGGFTEGEVRLARARGIQKVFLGDSTLRLETAFLGVISAIRFLIQGRVPPV